jgi:glucose 1-dehydrogenase
LRFKLAILDGKTAVITGATRGLGLAIASGLAAEGASIVIASRSEKSVAAALTELKVKGFRVFGMAVDVADLAQVEALAELAVRETGRLDIWVNNAGTAGPYGPTVDFTPEEFMRVIQTNIVGVYNGSRTAVRHFSAQQTGKLINILGHGYNGPVAWQNAYASSKAWVRSFSLALAAETKPLGIGVYAYNPGMVLTDLLTDVEVIRGHEEKLKNFPTIVRLMGKSPEDAARGAVRLATSKSDGKTGLLVSNFSTAAMMAKFALEGLRRVLNRPAAEPEIKMTSIPPAAQ